MTAQISVAHLTNITWALSNSLRLVPLPSMLDGLTFVGSTAEEVTGQLAQMTGEQIIHADVTLTERPITCDGIIRLHGRTYHRVPANRPPAITPPFAGSNGWFRTQPNGVLIYTLKGQLIAALPRDRSTGAYSLPVTAYESDCRVWRMGKTLYTCNAAMNTGYTPPQHAHLVIASAVDHLYAKANFLRDKRLGLRAA